MNHANLDLFNNTGGYSDSQTVNSAAFGQIIKASDPRSTGLAAVQALANSGEKSPGLPGTLLALGAFLWPGADKIQAGKVSSE